MPGTRRTERSDDQAGDERSTAVGLTSGLFEVLTVGLAVAGAAAVVWLWPRAAGRRIWHAGARMAMLAVSEILVVAALLVCMNSYFSFYTSWTQLTGSGQ